MEQVPNLYDQLVGGYWKRQQAQEDMRQKNLNFEQDYARDEMKIPEEVAKSRLATMTAEADQSLLPMQTAVKQQVLDDEHQFNVLKDMRSLIDDVDIPEQEKDEMFQRGILKLSGVSGQPTLIDAPKVARARYLIQGMKQNPQGAKAKIDEYMSTLARNFKSTQAQDLARTQGDIRHTDTLLKGDSAQKIAALRASFANKHPKNWAEYVQVQIAENTNKFGANAPETVAWKEEGRLHALYNPLLKSEVQGTQKYVDTTGKTPSLSNRPATKPKTIPPSVGGGTSQRGSVSVSGSNDLVAGALAELERRKQQGNK